MFKKQRAIIIFVLAVMLTMSIGSIFAIASEEEGINPEPIAAQGVSNEAPAEQTAAPAKETAAPAKAAPTPAKEKAAPIKETTAPTQAPESPAGEEKAPDEPAPLAEEQPQAEATPTAETEPAAEATAVPEESLAPVENAKIETGAEEEEQADVKRSVSIEVSGDPSSFKLGDQVVLKAKLKGYDGVQYEITWEYSEDGKVWHRAPGVSDQLTYTFTIDKENASWHWRVSVDAYETIEDDDVPLGIGNNSGGQGTLIALLAAFIGCGGALFLRYKKAQEAQYKAE